MSTIKRLQKKHNSKQGRIIELESLIHLFDDLYLFAENPKYLNAGVLGKCDSFFDLDKQCLTFVIRIRKNLTELDFFKTFLCELNHYHLDRLYFSWPDSGIGSKKASKHAIFVGEMLGHEECWDCRHFALTSCLRHPRNFIRIFLKECGVEKNDSTLVDNLLDWVLKELIISDRCLLNRSSISKMKSSPYSYLRTCL